MAHTDLDVAVAAIRTAYSLGDKPGMVNSKHAMVVVDALMGSRPELPIPDPIARAVVLGHAPTRNPIPSDSITERWTCSCGLHLYRRGTHVYGPILGTRCLDDPLPEG